MVEFMHMFRRFRRTSWARVLERARVRAGKRRRARARVRARRSFRHLDVLDDIVVTDRTPPSVLVFNVNGEFMPRYPQPVLDSNISPVPAASAEAPVGNRCSLYHIAFFCMYVHCAMIHVACTVIVIIVVCHVW
jgi:hypothetical protein